MTYLRIIFLYLNYVKYFIHVSIMTKTALINISNYIVIDKKFFPLMIPFATSLVFNGNFSFYFLDVDICNTVIAVRHK